MRSHLETRRPSALAAAVLRFRELVAVPEEDPAPRQVVLAELDQHAVERQDLDVVLADLAADVGQDDVAVGELDAELGVAQALQHGALQLDAVGCLGHQWITSSRLLPVRRAPAASKRAMAAVLASCTGAETVATPRRRVAARISAV